MSSPGKYASQIYDAFLKRLPEMRTARNWTIHELGKAAGVSGQVIHNIETRKTRMSLEMLARVAWALGMSVADLAQLLEPVGPEAALEKGERRELIRNNR